jgi:hypothetical protein
MPQYALRTVRFPVNNPCHNFPLRTPPRLVASLRGLKFPYRRVPRVHLGLSAAGVRFWRPIDLEEALANIPGQDADCVGLIGVNVYGSVPAWSSRSRAEQEEHDAMREIEIHDYARQLLEAHGAKAVAEAAQNAIELEAKGEVELARTWRHIEDALKLMRGPHQS